MSEPFLGEIRMVGFNFAARGWALCSGQTIPIQQNAALFSLLGTYYGGNGTTTFCLPDFQGRVPIHQGNGAGLTPYTIGDKGGAESVILSASQLPAHSHTVAVSSGVGTALTPTGNFLAAVPRGTTPPYAAGSNGAMAAGVISGGGSNLSHPNIQPYTCVNFIIALEGIFPSRN